MNTHPFMKIVRFTTCLALACGASAAADEWELIRSTVDGGGGMRSTGGSFELSGTIGQPDAGSMSGGVFELTGGFWFPLTPTDCNEDGAANLIDHAAFGSCMTGPAGDVPAGCDCFDLDGSGTIDLFDFAAAQASFQVFSGLERSD